jgi:photosystem II stability/assembly factor-like uncharacterized protein
MAKQIWIMSHICSNINIQHIKSAMFQRQARSSFPPATIFLAAAIVVGLLYFAWKKMQPATPQAANQLELNAEIPPSEAAWAVREYPFDAPDWSVYRAAMEAAAIGNVAERGPNNGLNTPWTVQGPGNIGARINTIKVHPTDANIIYIGYSIGGVWKTTDGGLNWTPLFDQQSNLNIADIELDPQNPDIVYVATGDKNIGLYVSVGNGLWKSTNGGQSWTNLGLSDLGVLSKIVIDPTNSQKIYVGVMGVPFIRDNNRGLYQTSDGGQTWTQSLFVSNQNGVIDLEMSPDNPQVLYAACWDRIRNNKQSVTTGINSGIWKSTDGGASWNRLLSGLPDYRVGRPGIDVDPNNSERLAVTYADSTNRFLDVFLSTDGGAEWIATNAKSAGFEEFSMGSFAWYFGKIEINPYDPDDIWVAGIEMWRTLTGGGDWFKTTPDWVFYEVHADMHDIVFVDANTVLIATDGGLYRSTDSGATWQKIENIPTTQFYRAAVNPHEPTWYYGGAQDNGTTGGNFDNITDWPRIFGGDGFQAVFHPTDPLIMYVETQNGNITFSDDGGQSFLVGTDGISVGDRRFWDMPYFISPHNPDVMYTGTYRVYRSDTHPSFWNVLSESLTDEVEFTNLHHTISAISESPITEGLLYVGTGDANVWRTEPDGSFAFVNISAGLPDRYVSSVRPSPTVANRVFVTHTGYRQNDNSAHIHRSDDYGQTWVPIAGNLPPVAINDVWVAPGSGDQKICVATEAGVWATLDGGQNWQRLANNMPLVRVMDLKHNVAQNTLVAATYGRSIMTFPVDSLIAGAEVSTQQISAPVQVQLWPTLVLRGQVIQYQVESTLPRPLLATVYHANGQVVWQQALGNSGYVATEKLAAGQYVVQITDHKRVVERKRIVVVQ